MKQIVIQIENINISKPRVIYQDSINLDKINSKYINIEDLSESELEIYNNFINIIYSK